MAEPQQGTWTPTLARGPSPWRDSRFPALLGCGCEWSHSSSWEQRCSMKPGSYPGALHSPRLPLTSPSASLPRSHRTQPALSQLGAVTPAEPSVRNTLPSSGPGTDVAPSGRPSLTLLQSTVGAPCVSPTSQPDRVLCNLVSVKSSLCLHVHFCPFLCRGGNWPASFPLCPPH